MSPFTQPTGGGTAAEDSAAFAQLVASSAALAVEGMPHRDENLACLEDLATVPAFELLSGKDLLADRVRVARNLEPLQPPGQAVSRKNVDRLSTILSWPLLANYLL